MTDDLSRHFRYDERKFRDSLELSRSEKVKQEQLIANIILLSHILEKSLSNDNFELGRSFSNLRYLADILKIYDQKGYDKKDLGYQSAISTARAVYEVHRDTKFADEVDGILSYSLNEIIDSNSDIGGSDKISASDKKRNSEKNFRDLSAGRFSVRSFANKLVNPKDIEEVVQISSKTPSVCNRQASRVRVVYDKDIIEKVLSVQSGMVGYPTPPCLMLITSDDSSFLGVHERNQGFIDGGLYAMSLLYALEYKGLAACSLNCMFMEGDEKTIRSMIGVPETEKLIMFIACGHFKKDNLVCKSFRYPSKHFLTEIKELKKVSHTPEPASDTELLLSAQGAELDMLRKPGIKFASRKLLGAIRRRMIADSTRVKSWATAGVVGVKRKLKLRTRLRSLGSKYENKKFDGAILTLNDDFNYGNVIQRYALQTYLRKHNLNFVQLKFYTEYLGEIRSQHLQNGLLNFIENNISCQDFDYVGSASYRCYVVGSDQVWRNHSADNILRDYLPYWLNFVFGKNKIHRISYGASFGVDNLKDAFISDDVAREVKPLLREFSAVSVRENTGIEMVDNIAGKAMKAKLVVDPTLLLTAQDYSDLIDVADLTASDSGVFSYILDMTKSKKKLIDNIASDLKAKSKVIVPDISEKMPPMEEWLIGFRDSKFIITDSFHGAVFSIINNKNFIVLANRKRGTARMESLLSISGIKKDRLVYLDEDKAINLDIGSLAPINWIGVNKKIDRLRRMSGEWLLDNINKG